LSHGTCEGHRDETRGQIWGETKEFWVSLHSTRELDLNHSFTIELETEQILESVLILYLRPSAALRAT
jgi:hypothetical protein